MACGAGTAAATLGADLVGHGRLKKWKVLGKMVMSGIGSFRIRDFNRFSSEFIRFHHHTQEIGSKNDFMTYGHASQHFKKMIVSEKRATAHTEFRLVSPLEADGKFGFFLSGEDFKTEPSTLW